MMNIFVEEFCDQRGEISKWNRYARVVVYDVRNRKRQSFVITRTALPKNTRPGDKIAILNVTKENQCQQQIV